MNVRFNLVQCIVVFVWGGLTVSGSYAEQASYTAKYHLDRLWPTSSENSGIVAYKQNYLLLLNSTDFPNYTPTSPNLKNQVTPSYIYAKQEAKFQFSLKSQYPHPDILGESNSLWFGYTQQSHWQVTNSDNSRPFRESNYEPEPLIISHQFESPPDTRQWSPRYLNFGVVHQSNGQALPASRSWNRVYFQLGAEKRLSDISSMAVTIKPWMRFSENSDQDDNPDIYDYLGHGEIEMLYWYGKHLVSTLVRSRSLQFDWSWSNGGEKSLHWHVQIFSGYGESLIDYNQQHSSAGIGVSLPYDLEVNSKE